MRSTIKSLVAIAVVLAFSTTSFGALNAYLKITGKNVSKTVKLSCPKDACTATVDELPAGKYTITLCDSKGQPLTLKVKEKGNRTKCTATLRYEVKSPRDVATGQSSGKRTHTDEQSPTSEVKRDAASGMPTGKRTHKPITITKTLDKSSPVLMATADLDSDGALDIAFSWSWTDGGVTADDDWESPSN